MSGLNSVFGEARQLYLEQQTALREAFQQHALSGTDMIRERSASADMLLRTLWKALCTTDDEALGCVATVAVGGYGRQELFPCSDLDLLFCVNDKSAEEHAKGALRRLAQWLWDCGVRVAATTRQLSECQRLHGENVEFALALLDARPVCGSETLSTQLLTSAIPALTGRDGDSLRTRMLQLTDDRHARYGDTLFHLEPNIKDCPGGLRDRHVAAWLARLTPSSPPQTAESEQAFAFLAAVRCFLHVRTGRDVNALDWKTQDAAATEGIGVPGSVARTPAHWMQLYFRHARAISRNLQQQVEAVPGKTTAIALPRFFRRDKSAALPGMRLKDGRVVLDPATATDDPALNAETALTAFRLIAETGAKLDRESAGRLEDGIPALSMQMEDGAQLWARLRPILLGEHAGRALRLMHELGLLELLVPEFHGIDALVVRDGYHRYTVDEHTFVVIDTLHELTRPGTGPMAQWRTRFAAIVRDLQHPDLLYLAALLHDTGKGRSTGEHTRESARLSKSVLARLEVGEFDAGLVLSLVANHLEMSAALRRDIFDAETVRAFAAKVHSPEELRMLTLFTFADIHAVHPDALTPWKAENLWRLYIATSNYLDRNIDDERVDARVSSDLVLRVTQSLPNESREVLHFLEGFPQRYMQTRSPEQIRMQYAMGKRLAEDPVQLDFAWNPERSEVTLVTPDRRLLFARIAGVLAAWGMSIITADAFSNARGIVVDTFRFTDTFRTLEKNPSERQVLVRTLHDAIADPALAAGMVASRKRSRRRAPLVEVATSIHFETTASTHSTLLQVVAQDVPGLLYAISTALGEAGCDIHVAVIDTEGETAIDVFYLTQNDAPLDPAVLPALEDGLLRAIAANAA